MTLEQTNKSSVQAVIVGVAGESFALAQDDIFEIVQSAQVPVGLPLVCLRGLLGFPEDKSSPANYVAIVKPARGGCYGLIVENVTGAEDISCIPLDMVMPGMDIFVGNAILEDGFSLLVLDAARIAPVETANSDVFQAQLQSLLQSPEEYRHARP